MMEKNLVSDSVTSAVVSGSALMFISSMRLCCLLKKKAPQEDCTRLNSRSGSRSVTSTTHFMATHRLICACLKKM